MDMEKTRVSMRGNGSQLGTSWSIGQEGYIDGYLVRRDIPYMVVILNGTSSHPFKTVIYCQAHEALIIDRFSDETGIL